MARSSTPTTPTPKSSPAPKSARSARSRRSPARTAAAPAATAPAAQARPIYFSDGDTRPVYRGALYGWIRRTGVAWFVLGTYAGFALVDARRSGALLMLCRTFHVVTCDKATRNFFGSEHPDHHVGRDLGWPPG